MRLWLRGGDRSESLPGLAWVTGRMLIEGSAHRSWRQIADDSEDLGMALESFGGLETHGLRLDCLCEDWQQGLRWLAELAFEPSFPEDRCRWVCQQAVAELESLADQPEVKTGWSFAEQLYYPHPAGRPTQGTPSSLGALSAADCSRFHHQGLAAGGVLAIAGLVDEDEVHASVEELFAGLQEGADKARSVPEPEGLAIRRRCIETGSGDQAHLFMGHLTVPLAHADYRALELLSVILGSGAGLTGRIPARIREKEGLAYSTFAAAVIGAGLDPGRFVLGVATSPDTLERAEACVLEELDRLLEEGTEQQELDDARAYLLGREPFRRETAHQWADLEAQTALYGVALDDPEWLAQGLRELSVGQLDSIANDHLSPTAIKTTVGLPAGGGDPV